MGREEKIARIRKALRKPDRISDIIIAIVYGLLCNG